METNNENTLQNEDDIIFVHPSYEIYETFMLLGFRETVLTDNQPEDRNFYIISREYLSLLTEKVFMYNNKTIVLNEQDRVLLRVNDRWDKKRIMNFVENPEPPKDLYREIKNTIKDYIEFQNEAIYGIMTAWIIATYFYRCFHAFPFLFIYGKKQSGKSRFLDLLERLSFNAMKVKGASVAALADSIDGVRGTFLNDQAEELSNKKNTEILGILSDSYTTGGGKRRIVNTANKVRRIQEFETYGPKAFASIKDLDSDLKDRCIEITMVRALKEYPYPDAYLTIWGDLRDKLYKNLLSKWQEVKVLYRDTGKDVSHRMKELWRPIETILKLENVSDEETRDIKGFFLESMQETQNELSENEIKLFETLKEILGEKDKEILTVTEIAEKFNKESKTIDEKEKRRIQIWIGRTINQLSLYTKHAGKKDGRKAYEFSYQHIENIQKRYETDETLGDYREIPGDSREIDPSSHNHNPDNELVDREIENEEIGVGSSIPEREIEI